jgi:hypothetical protein
MEPASKRRFALETRAAFIAVIALGLGAYTFVYARVTRIYNASACANCHIMREHYDA